MLGTHSRQPRTIRRHSYMFGHRRGTASRPRRQDLHCAAAQATGDRIRWWRARRIVARRDAEVSEVTGQSIRSSHRGHRHPIRVTVTGRARIFVKKIAARIQQNPTATDTTAIYEL